MGKTWSESALQVLNLVVTGRELHGYAIAKQTGITQTSVYTILQRFEQEGLVQSHTERVSALAPRIPKVVYHGTTCAFDEMQHIRKIVGCSVA